MSNRIKRTLAIALCSSSLGFAVTPVSQAAPAAADNRCTPVRLVYVKGTFSSKSDDSTHPDRMHEGKDLYNAMAKAVGSHNVSGYSVSYPASVGAISPFLVAGMNINGWGGGNEAVTFGDSVKTAVKNGTEHIAEYKRACPNTTFVIGGYSQGASAAGTIASEIAAGKVPGVTSDDVGGVLLYADPYRAAQSDFDSYSGQPKSKLYAQPMQGVMGRNLETIVGYAPNGRKDFVGWAGPRPDSFKGMQGKVMSLCHDLDPACSVPANGMLRMIADYVDKENSYPLIGNAQTFQKLQKFNQAIIQNGVPDKAMRADPSTGDAVAKAFFAAGFTFDDLATLITAIKEVAELTTRMYKDAGVEQKATYEEFLLMLLITALPHIVQSGTSHDALIALLSNEALTAAIAPLGPEAVAAQKGAIATLQALKKYDIAMTTANELSSKAGLPQLPAMSSRLVLSGSSFVAELLPEVKIAGSSLVDDGSSIGSSQDLSSGGSSLGGSSLGRWLSNRGSSEGGGSSNMGIGIGGSSIGNVDRDDVVVLSSNYQENIDKAKARAEKGDYITVAEILGINFGSATQSISMLVAQALGLLKKMRGPEFQSVLDEARILGQFGYHASYWDGRFKVDGVSGGDAAEKWVAEIARNVVGGKSWDYQPQGKSTNEVEPDIEKSIEPYSVRYFKEHPQITKEDLYEDIKGYAFVVKRDKTGWLSYKDRVYVYPEGTPEYEKYYNESSRKMGKMSMIRMPKDSFPEANAGFGDPMFLNGNHMVLVGDLDHRAGFDVGSDLEEFKEAMHNYMLAYAVNEEHIPPNDAQALNLEKEWVYTGHVKDVEDREYSEFKAPDFSGVKVDVPAEGSQPSTPAPKPSTQKPAPSSQEKKPTTQKPAPSSQPKKTTTQKPAPSSQPKKTTTQKPAPSSQQKKTTTQKPAPSSQAKKTTTQKPAPSSQPKKTTTQKPAPSSQEQKPSTQKPSTQKPAPETIGNYPTRDVAQSRPIQNETDPNRAAVNIPPTSKTTRIDMSQMLSPGEVIKGTPSAENGWKVTHVKDNIYEVTVPKNNTPGTLIFTIEGPEGPRQLHLETLTPEFNADALKWGAPTQVGNATVLKGPGSYNGRFIYKKYDTPITGRTLQPAADSREKINNASNVDGITVNPDTGDITVADTVPSGTYVVPVQITDTKTGKDAVVSVTVVKDDKGVKIEQPETVTDVQKESSAVEGKEPKPSVSPGTHAAPATSVTERPSQTPVNSNEETNTSTVLDAGPDNAEDTTSRNRPTQDTATNDDTAEEISPSAAQTTNIVRKVLASTGASLELLALVSLILAGIGVSVLVRRKDS